MSTNHRRTQRHCAQDRNGSSQVMRSALLFACVLFLSSAPAFSQNDAGTENSSIAVHTQVTASGAPADTPVHTEGTSVSNNDSGVTALDQPSAARVDLSNRHLTLGDRLQIYRHSVFSPLTFIGPTVGAGLGLWENEPAEWGQGAAGYGRRFGSSMGRTLSVKTITFAVAALDGEDPRYIPSEQSGLVARSRHAIAATFVSRREDGSRLPAISLFVAAYGSAFLANTWYPPSKSTVPHALQQGSTKLLSTTGLHLLHEFWPDIKRMLHFQRGN
jgi:hypothetical protein